VVYTKLSDFSNNEARGMMLRYINDQKGLQAQEAKLRSLRKEYAEGNLTIAENISQLEKEVDYARNALLARRNSVIKLELTK
jgi:hypothetical protein